VTRPVDRRRYREQVQTLLERIAHETGELRRLHAAGVRAAALVERKRELALDRARLAELVGAA
jgi:hypothetical protein